MEGSESLGARVAPESLAKNERSAEPADDWANVGT